MFDLLPLPFLPVQVDLEKQNLVDAPCVHNFFLILQPAALPAQLAKVEAKEYSAAGQVRGKQRNIENS